MSVTALLLGLMTLPFAGAVVAGMVPRARPRAAAAVAGGVALAAHALVWVAYPAVAEGTVLRTEWEWLGALGLRLVLRLDGLAWLFAALVTGIGALVVLYARYYMDRADPVPRFFAFLLAFQGAMLGVVSAGNLVQLVFFWELTSLCSFLLIGYWHHLRAAREGARMALTVTGAGGLALFAAVLILGHIIGSFELDALLAAGEVLRDHSLYPLVLGLLLAGALSKSAQFPFHFWLPRAMAAPTPVSAYLHSATLVKLGVFLLVRVWPVMAGTEAWLWSVGLLGLITLVIGAWIAIFENDLKGLLAYSTISHLGLIMLLLGLKSELALVAALFHTLNHAAFKCSLFMAAGIIDHETGTRDIRRLSGLNRLMPFTGRLALVAAAAMAGVPLLNGFISKEMFFAETLAATAPQHPLLTVLPFAALAASAFSVTYSLRFIHGTFFGPDPEGLPRTPHEPPSWMRLPVEILVLTCIVVGLLPAATVGPYLAIAVQAVLGEATPHYDLAVWHGFTLPLAMSIVAMTIGAGLYRLLQVRWRSGPEGAPLIRRFDAGRLFELVLVTLSWRLARRLYGALATERLQPQLRLLFTAAVLAGGGAVVARQLGPGNLPAQPPELTLAAVWVMGGIAAVFAALTAARDHLSALIFAGAAGIAVIFTFVWFSAPDLAITQLTVEVVTTMLLLLGLRWLPRREARLAPQGRGLRHSVTAIGDVGLALGAGIGIGVLAFAVMTRIPLDPLARHYLARAYVEGGGTNVVNVILVDFRSFDTLGEIFVVAIVALAAYALLRRFRPSPDSWDTPPLRQGGRGADRGLLGVPFLLGRLVFLVLLLVALHLLLRGHDLPGGGFSAGMTVAIGVLLLYLLGGADWTETQLRFLRPLRWIGTGLMIATVCGVAAMLFGRPFLTTFFAYAEVPILGKVPLASALIFDIGIFTLVVGATLLLLVALAHQSLRGRRARPEERQWN